MEREEREGGHIPGGLGCGLGLPHHEPSPDPSLALAGSMEASPLIILPGPTAQRVTFSALAGNVQGPSLHRPIGPLGPCTPAAGRAIANPGRACLSQEAFKLIVICQ